MSSRARVLSESGNLIHRSSPDFLYTSLFAVLSVLHAGIAVPAFLHQRWEGCLSAVFCPFFATVAVLCRTFCFEIAVLRDEKKVRIRHGVGRLFVERVVPFGAITDVRLTLLGGKGPESSQIELLSRNDDIRLPHSDQPRQEALLLAMMLDVPLVKVYGDNVLPDRDRVPTSVE